MSLSGDFSQKNEILFSVIIPVYNGGKFIIAALDSVREQEYFDFEIIVVNDGSTDNSEILIQGWMQKNTKINIKYLSQENKGLGATRNRALKIASGKYLAFLDQDDRWLPDKLSVISGYAATYPDIDLFCHDLWFEIEGKAKFKSIKAGPFTSYHDLLLKGNTIMIPAVIVKREVVLSYGGFSEAKEVWAAEDLDLWLKMLKQGARIMYVPETLGIYYVNSKGLSKNIVLHANCEKFVLDTHLAKLNKNLKNTWLIRKRWALFDRARARAYLNIRDFKSARKYILSAIKKNPFLYGL